MRAPRDSPDWMPIGHNVERLLPSLERYGLVYSPQPFGRVAPTTPEELRSTEWHFANDLARPTLRSPATTAWFHDEWVGGREEAHAVGIPAVAVRALFAQLHASQLVARYCQAQVPSLFVVAGSQMRIAAAIAALPDPQAEYWADRRRVAIDRDDLSRALFHALSELTADRPLLLERTIVFAESLVPGFPFSEAARATPDEIETLRAQLL